VRGLRASVGASRAWFWDRDEDCLTRRAAVVGDEDVAGPAVPAYGPHRVIHLHHRACRVAAFVDLHSGCPAGRRAHLHAVDNHGEASALAPRDPRRGSDPDAEVGGVSIGAAQPEQEAELKKKKKKKAARTSSARPAGC